MLKINCQWLFKKSWWKYTWLRLQIHTRFTTSLWIKSQWYFILGIKDGPSQKCFLWSTNFCSYSNSTCRYLKYNVSSILPSLLDFLCMYCHLAEKKKQFGHFFLPLNVTMNEVKGNSSLVRLKFFILESLLSKFHCVCWYCVFFE